MFQTDKMPPELASLLEARLGRLAERFMIPPPVLEMMRGEPVSLSLQEKWLIMRFPVLHEQLNPYGYMQGGMIAAAIDNTLGPLSMLIAPPNFTRRFEIKYREGVPSSLDYIRVTGRLIEQKRRQLFFSASVTGADDKELASARSIHWIVDGDRL